MKDYQSFASSNTVSEFKSYISVESKKANITDVKVLYNNFVTILYKLSFHHKIDKKETKYLNNYIENTYNNMKGI